MQLKNRELIKSKSNNLSNITENLITKLEEQVAKISFNTNVLVRSVEDNHTTREFLTTLYTNINRVFAYFEFVQDISFELSGRHGRIYFKGKFAPESFGKNIERDKSDVKLMFRSLKESSISGVIVESGKLVISYQDFNINLQKVD